MLLLNNNIHEMVKEKEHPRITQSGKNCAINYTIQGVHLI